MSADRDLAPELVHALPDGRAVGADVNAIEPRCDGEITIEPGLRDAVVDVSGVRDSDAPDPSVRNVRGAVEAQDADPERRELVGERLAVGDHDLVRGNPLWLEDMEPHAGRKGFGERGVRHRLSAVGETPAATTGDADALGPGRRLSGAPPSASAIDGNAARCDEREQSQGRDNGSDGAHPPSLPAQPGASETRAKRGRRSRSKGAAFQAELAKRWRDSRLYPDAASTQGAQTRSGRRIGKTPPDVEGTPFWVEAKHTRAANPVGALRQAERERKTAGDSRPAIAVVRPNGDRLVGPVVCMRLETFEELMATLERLRRKPNAEA